MQTFLSILLGIPFPHIGEKKESEKAEIFMKIEPYLNFLNIHQLERQGADILSKANELKEASQYLREMDKTRTMP